MPFQDCANTLLEKILNKELQPDQLQEEVHNLELHPQATVSNIGTNKDQV